MSSVADPAHRLTILQLGRDRLASGEPLQLKVISASMWPCLRPGDWVKVAPCGEESIQYGDLLVVECGQEWITHRLVGRRERSWITKGDHLCEFDPPVPASQVVGRVVALRRPPAPSEQDICTPGHRLVACLLARVSWMEGRLFQAFPHRPWRYLGHLAALPGRALAFLLAVIFWLF